MPKNKKKFIDKKNAVTFHLVHRSQQDPLITDETAPQHVLVESGAHIKQLLKPNIDPEKRKKEQQKYGIYFDDEYDYLQHLREPGKEKVSWEYVPPTNLKLISENDRDNVQPKLQLPSSVFASEFEEKIGLLRKAAPQPGPKLDWDPDIVAGLDDDFEFNNPNNELDDYFMQKAMDDGEEINEYNENSDVNSNFSEEEYDELGPLHAFEKEEVKSRFTEYSMSSSVIRRNEQLALLDERFEKFFERYDEPEIGALDCEEIEGHVELNDDIYSQCWKELEKNDHIEEYNKNWDKYRIEQIQAGNEYESEEELLDVSDNKTEQWDCESILSTYSNLYNHPKLIEEPRKSSKIVINRKTGLPLNVFHGENSQLTAKTLAKFNMNSCNSEKEGPKSLCAESVLSVLSVLSIRPKDETPLERLERKRLLREYRNERRIERKANQLAFKEEKKRQIKIKMNNRNNLQGNKIV